MNKKILAVAFASTLALAGCQNQPTGENTSSNIQAPSSSTEQVTEESSEQSNQSSTTASNDKTSTTGSGTITEVASMKDVTFSFEDAVESFQSEYPEAAITSVELDREGNGFVYDINGETTDKEYELKFDAMSGEILHREEERDNDEVDDALNLGNVLSIPDVLDIAAQNGLGEVRNLELSIDDGVVRWQIEDVNDVELDIHAESGEVLEFDS